MTSRSASCHSHYDDLSGCIKTIMISVETPGSASGSNISEILAQLGTDWVADWV